MKTRLLLAITLSLFCLSIFAQLSDHPVSAQAPDHALTNWLQARIKAQLEGRDDGLARRFPAATLSPVNGFDAQIKRIDQASITSLSDLIVPLAGPLDNLRVNDPAQESGSRVQNGTSSAVSGQNIVVAYNDIGTKISAISYSNDGGRSWQQTHIDPLPGGRNLGSAVVAARANTFYYAGVGLNSNNVALIIFSQSTDAGRTWSPPSTVNVPAVNFLIQDKPWITVDNSKAATAGNIYISWTEIRASGSRIQLAASTDGGRTFPTISTLSPVDGSAVVQGSTIAIGPGGEVHVAWGDLRVKGIRYTQSVNAGVTFSRAIGAATLESYELLGPLLNSHFSTNGLPQIAVDTSDGINRGTIYIVFSAPSPDNRQDKANVFLVRSATRGVSFSLPQRINNDTGLTDQFMPSVAVATDGTVGIMWYDRRNDTEFNGLLDVYAAASTDGGVRFAANRRITTGNWLLLTTPNNIRNNYHGDYNQMSALTDRAGFFFVWGDDRSGLDADVFSAQMDVSALLSAQNDLIMSAITPSQTVTAGQNTVYRVRVANVESVNGLSFSAASDTDAISFEIDTRSPVLANEVFVRVRTSPSVTPGSHPVIVRAESSALGITTTTLRLNVAGNGSIGVFPANASRSLGSSAQPTFTFDRQGNVSAVWVDDSPGNFRAFFSRSADRGNTFSDPIDLSQNIATSINPAVAVDDRNNIHVAWQECGTVTCLIKYARSTDNGATFTEGRVISQNLEFSEIPSVITNPNGEVAVTWDGARTFMDPRFEIFAVRSTNNGESFSPPTAIASGDKRNLFTSAATSDGTGRSYLVYESCADGNCRIELIKSTDSFATVTKGGVASEGIAFSIRPTISAPGRGALFVAMSSALADGDLRFDIFTSASFDDGMTFSPPKNISNNVEASTQPTIASNGQDVFVAWTERSSGNPEIFLARSQDRGANYGAPVNITNNVTISQQPTIGFDSNGALFLSLQDEPDGNDETYVARIAGQPRAAALATLSPDNGPPGTTVSIRGRDLTQVSAVTIGGRDAQFFTSSPSELIAVVPDGARTGPVIVRTTGGNATGALQFTVTGGISAGPSIDFGTVIAGQVRDPQFVAIKNFGTTAVRINSLTLSSIDFRLLNMPTLPAVLNAGEVLRLPIRFLPNAQGEAQGMLRIGSDDRVLPNINVPLAGRATAPVLTVIAPQGREKLRAGEPFQIQWQVQGRDAAGFDLLLSTDGGRTFNQTITQNLGSTDRSFTWTVPPIKAKAARVAVVMRATDATAFFAISNSDFKIKMKK